MLNNNPNQEVENWKDAVYEDTHKMNKKELSDYFQKQMGNLAVKRKKRDILKKKLAKAC